MTFADDLKRTDVNDFKNAPAVRALLEVIGPDGVSFAAVTAAMLAGSGGGDGGGAVPTVTATYPPQSLSVTSTATPLTVPSGANTATVHVISGTVRRSIGGTPSTTTPALSVGDSEDIQGAELAAYRLIRDGGSDAAVQIEYRTVG